MEGESDEYNTYNLELKVSDTDGTRYLYKPIHINIQENQLISHSMKCLPNMFNFTGYTDMQD